MPWNLHSTKTNNKQLLLEESLFFTGNGYLGVRGNLEEGSSASSDTIRGTYINGFYDHVPIQYGEKMTGFPDKQQKLLNIMDTQSVNIHINGEKFSITEGTVHQYNRELDFKHGIQTRTIHWCSPKGTEVNITFQRIASFIYKNIFDQLITIETADKTVQVTVESIMNGNVSNFTDPDDPRVAGHAQKSLFIQKLNTNKNQVYMEMQTAKSNLSVAALSTLSIDLPNIQYSDQTTEQTGITSAAFQLQGKATIHKRTIFTDSIRNDNVKDAAYSLMKEYNRFSFQNIAISQHQYLQQFWKHTDVTIDGNNTLQEALRFNLFHILQSAGQDGLTNIAAKGLSGEGYEGHYFWDTEIYLLPIFTITNPDLAKKLLLYRYSILPQAKERAIEMGHKKGALFPWRTISGSECSSYFPAGTAQYHISADIAHSYIQYYLATQDIHFLQEAGAEVLVETARLWLETGHFYEESFRIDTVTGPDEYTCIVNNNYYTNLMAKQNLEWACSALQLITEHDAAAGIQLRTKLNIAEEELALFKKAARQMYLPVDAKLQINPQDDTFLKKAPWDFEHVPKSSYPLLLHYHPLTIYRYQVCKQADTVLAHLLIEDGQSEEVIQNSYYYYEKITSHDSSLSACVFSMMAARIGEINKAYNYFIKSARLDLDNTQGNTKDGLHLANMGGTWMAVVAGFAGMRIKKSGLMFRPQIPKTWNSYSFRFYYLGSLLKMTVTTADCSIELLEGDPVSIYINEETYTIKQETIISLPKVD